MYKYPLRLSLLALALCAGTAYAQSSSGVPPSNVTGVAANLQNGSLTVSWNPATDATGIAYYRIYFSRQSILGNQGNYDDFERTQGPDTSYTFQSLPFQGTKIYLSVMAVNLAGVESTAFQEEASADLPAGSAVTSSTNSSLPVPVLSSSTATSVPSIPPLPSSAPSTSAIPFTLLNAYPITSTGVLVEFSSNVSTVGPIPTAAFVIVDASGARLSVNETKVVGGSIILKTSPQRQGDVYVLEVLEPLTDVEGTPLSGSVQASFVGLAPLMPPVSPSSSAVYVRNPGLPPAPIDRIPPDDPADLALRATRILKGKYRVNAEWQPSPNATGDLASYNVYTTTDGQSFAKAGVAQPTDNAALFPNVSSGTFGVKVTSVDHSGNESGGITRIITLPQSGIGLTAVFALSGALAGGRTARRKKRSGA